MSEMLSCGHDPCPASWQIFRGRVAARLSSKPLRLCILLLAPLLVGAQPDVSHSRSLVEAADATSARPAPPPPLHDPCDDFPDACSVLQPLGIGADCASCIAATATVVGSADLGCAWTIQEGIDFVQSSFGLTWTPAVASWGIYADACPATCAAVGTPLSPHLPLPAY